MDAAAEQESHSGDLGQRSCRRLRGRGQHVLRLRPLGAIWVEEKVHLGQDTMGGGRCGLKTWP